MNISHCGYRDISRSKMQKYDFSKYHYQKDKREEFCYSKISPLMLRSISPSKEVKSIYCEDAGKIIVMKLSEVCFFSRLSIHLFSVTKSCALDCVPIAYSSQIIKLTINHVCHSTSFIVKIEMLAHYYNFICYYSEY